MTYFVYLLECIDGSIYTGITTDVERRFREHVKGEGANYTRSRGAKKIVHIEKCKDRSTAQKREAEIKGFNRRKKLELIKVIR